MNARLPSTAAGFVLLLLVLCGCNQSAPGTTASDPAIQLVPLTNMAFVKAGTFLRIQYPVTLTRDFWIGKYEVTQREFESLMGKNPSHFTGNPNRPVEKVTHNDAVAYCLELTKRERMAGRLPSKYEYRLPSEAEWEYACRAGTTNHFSFGDDEDVAEEYAWTAENSNQTTHPVGLKKPNPWGLHDMHGNVWEWTLDWFANYPAEPAENPIGPPEGQFKIFRGGGWNQDAKYARSSNRFMMAPHTGIHFVGFRVALGEIAKP